MEVWSGSAVDVKAWVDGVPVEPDAIQQLKNVANLPFIFKHVAAMPDIHVGAGACIGSVIPTKGATIPSAVGCDIGCGMNAVKTNLKVSALPSAEIRSDLRKEIERLIPIGRTNNGGKGDKGAWETVPERVLNVWNEHLKDELKVILEKNPRIKGRHGLNDLCHLSSLGGGNHFIEICLDLDDTIWIMLHSGSRGVGNAIGTFFMKKAKEVCSDGSKSERDEIDAEVIKYFKSKEFKDLSKANKKQISKDKRDEAKEKKKLLGSSLPHPDLAFFSDDDPLFGQYLEAVQWAQKYAAWNRKLMLESVIKAVENICGEFETEDQIACHHNYCSMEEHFGEKIWVTRKGAISAQEGELGIIPSSMGEKSFIVKGKGNPESFCSASHGAGRKMSRTEARKTFTVEEHIAATEGVECSKSAATLDETPGCYKDIDAVIAAEKDLVEPITQLKQIICIKGSDENDRKKGDKSK